MPLGGSYGQLAQVMYGGRMTGKSHAIVKLAPKNAIILAVTHQHADYLRQLCLRLDRADLNVEVFVEPFNVTNKSPYIPDHFTIEQLFFRADREIETLREQNNKLTTRVKQLERKKGV